MYVRMRNATHDVASRRIGDASEATARSAIQQLIRKGALTTFTEPRAANHAGMDFILVRTDGARVPLQVKSSFTGAEQHRRRHPHIPVVIVGKRNTRTVQREILRILREEYP